MDGITFMDDWGSERALLISPKMWTHYFKPLYKAYCDLAKAHGKFVFMHSDGYIFDIYEHLVEIGVDAVNSQLFTMPIESAAAASKDASPSGVNSTVSISALAPGGRP